MVRAAQSTCAPGRPCAGWSAPGPASKGGRFAPRGFAGGAPEARPQTTSSAARTGPAIDLSRVAVQAPGRARTDTVISRLEPGITTETQVGEGLGPLLDPEPTGSGGWCNIQSASFASIPSGAVAATMSGSKLSASFTMIGDFAPRIPCNCSCGEYRQYVRGTFTANGSPVAHSLGGGRLLDPTTFQEDGDVAAGTVYGHRSVVGTKSIFTPDQAGGCRFEGSDEPGISNTGSGVALAMNLDFRGELIDTCRSNTVLASSSWTVSGSGTTP